MNWFASPSPFGYFLFSLNFPLINPLAALTKSHLMKIWILSIGNNLERREMLNPSLQGGRVTKVERRRLFDPFCPFFVAASTRRLPLLIVLRRGRVRGLNEKVMFMLPQGLLLAPSLGSLLGFPFFAANGGRQTWKGRPRQATDQLRFITLFQWLTLVLIHLLERNFHDDSSHACRHSPFLHLHFYRSPFGSS